MDSSEVEFLAEKETVKIIPNFSLDKIYLIGVSKAKYSCKLQLLFRKPTDTDIYLFIFINCSLN